VDYQIIDVGTHATPPATMWQERYPKELRDQAPRRAWLRYEDDGEYEVLVLDGIAHRARGGSMGVPFADYEDPDGWGRTYEDGLAGNRDPLARLDDMELDGVSAHVIVRNDFPHLWPKDRRVWWGMIRAYNDWLIDFCSVAPDRLLGVGELPCWDMDLMLDEVKKIKAGGLKAVQLPIAPGYVGDWSAPADRNYTDPWWEPLWNVLDDLHLPIVSHVEALAATPGMNGYLNGMASTVNMWTNKSVPSEMVSSLILCGAFERHPNLKLVLNETGAGWLAPLIAWAELCIDQSHREKVYSPLGLSRRPKEYINDHVIASFLWDTCAVKYRDDIGVDSLAWCSDYPENYGTFGKVKVQIDKDLAGTTDAERHTILAGNAVRTFGL